MKMKVFWDIAPWSIVKIDRRFRYVYRLHHQGDKWWFKCLHHEGDESSFSIPYPVHKVKVKLPLYSVLNTTWRYLYIFSCLLILPPSKHYVRSTFYHASWYICKFLYLTYPSLQTLLCFKTLLFLQGRRPSFACIQKKTGKCNP